MRDPFEKARKIRKGELDAELPMFDELTGWFQRVPKTWLPGLLRAVVAACVNQKIFHDGKLVGYVERCEKIAKDPYSMLRSDQQEPTNDH